MAHYKALVLLYHPSYSQYHSITIPITHANNNPLSIHPSSTVPLPAPHPSTPHPTTPIHPPHHTHRTHPVSGTSASHSFSPDESPLHSTDTEDTEVDTGLDLLAMGPSGGDEFTAVKVGMILCVCVYRSCVIEYRSARCDLKV